MVWEGVVLRSVANGTVVRVSAVDDETHVRVWLSFRVNNVNIR